MYVMMSHGMIIRVVNFFLIKQANLKSQYIQLGMSTIGYLVEFCRPGLRPGPSGY